MSLTRKRSAAVLEDSPMSNIFFDPTLPRSGKWTSEEEAFANKLISEFEAGTLLDCIEGCTLRAYLAKRLNCAPMRISKKYAGQCIGKHTFIKKDKADDEVAQVNSTAAERKMRRTDCSSSASTSSAASSNSSAADVDEPNYRVLKGNMSFDTFTEFQKNQPSFSAPFSHTGPQVQRNFWPSFAPGYHPQNAKRQRLNEPFWVRATERSEPLQEDAVGLDIDNPEHVSGSSLASYSGDVTDTSSLTASPASVVGRKGFIKREKLTENVCRYPVNSATTFFTPPPPLPLSPPQQSLLQAPWASSLLRCPSEDVLHTQAQSSDAVSPAVPAPVPLAAVAAVPPHVFFPAPAAAHCTTAPPQQPPQLMQLGPYYAGTYFSSGGVMDSLLLGEGAVGKVEERSGGVEDEAEEWRNVLTFFCGQSPDGSAFNSHTTAQLRK